MGWLVCGRSQEKRNFASSSSCLNKYLNIRYQNWKKDAWCILYCTTLSTYLSHLCVSVQAAWRAQEVWRRRWEGPTREGVKIYPLTKIERDVKIERGDVQRDYRCICNGQSEKASLFYCKETELLQVLPVYKVASWWCHAQCVMVRHLVFLSEIRTHICILRECVRVRLY